MDQLSAASDAKTVCSENKSASVSIYIFLVANISHPQNLLSVHASLSLPKKGGQSLGVQIPVRVVVAAANEYPRLK